MLIAYSDTWFDHFLHSIPSTQTEHEVQFIARQFPLATHGSILDICCGPGRHAGPLVARGYRVTGIDMNHRQLEIARKLYGDRVEWIEQDMRDLDNLKHTFDGAMILWQSFGYFDDRDNQQLLNAIARRLNPGGRLLLDVYHRTFFENHSGSREFEKDGQTIREIKQVRDKRLAVELHHGQITDRFDWRLYTPDELIEHAAEAGFTKRICCSEFDESVPVSEDKPRLQLVLELMTTNRS